MCTHFGTVETIEKLEGGIENDVYKVGFANGKIAVARVYRNKTADQVQGEIELLRMAKNRVSCAHLIEPLKGDYPLFVDGRPLTVIEFIKGYHVSRESLTSEILAQVGHNLRGLHEVTSGICLRPYWGIEQILQQGESLINGFSGCAAYQPWRSRVNAELDIVRKAAALVANRVMIHADVALGNFIVDGSGAVIFIDFDDCGFAPAELDLGITIRNLVLKSSLSDRNGNTPINRMLVRALVNGYGIPRINNLGTWTRIACLRHTILMLHNSFCSLFYPSKNSDNLKILELACAVEAELNDIVA